MALRVIVPVTCCGQDMTAERIELPDGRRRFTLSCEVCWESTVEFSRPEVITTMYRGNLITVGTIRVPA
jgi:hypothetical protein